MLRSFEATVDIPHGVSQVPQHLCLLLRQLPTLALGAISAAISTATTPQELGVSNVGNIGFKGSIGQILKTLQHTIRLVIAERVHTLEQRDRSQRKWSC